MSVDQTNAPLPVLAMDMDGTVLLGDTNLELLRLCAVHKPLLLPFALAYMALHRPKGKEWLQKRIIDRFDPSRLRFEMRAIELMKSHAASGHEVWMVSGSHQKVVELVAGYLKDEFGVSLDRVKGTVPDGPNLVSNEKAAYLVEHCPDGFYYAGNSRQDIAVWMVAQKGFGYNAPENAYALKKTNGEPVQLERIV
jgi:phosphoserine phosphatase